MIVKGHNGHGSTWLNAGQVQCMLLVGDHLTSKQIAKRLGISSHTVDQRIRDVLRLTGAPSRREAARLIKSHAATGGLQEPGNSDHQPSGAASAAARANAAGKGLTWPFATYPGQVNAMGLGQRSFWIMAISCCAFLSTAMYLAGLESLARLLSTH